MSQGNENDIEINLIFDDTQLNESLKKVARNMEGIEKNANETNEALDDAFKGNEIVKYNRKLATAEKSTKELGATTTKVQKDFQREAKKTNRELDQTKKRIGGIESGLKRFARGGLRRALASSGIGALIVIISTLSDTITDFASNVLNALGPVGALIRNIIGGFRDLGSILTGGFISSTAQIGQQIEAETEKIAREIASLEDNIAVIRAEGNLQRLKREQATARQILKGEEELLLARRNLNGNAIDQTIREQNRLVAERLKIEEELSKELNGNRTRELEKELKDIDKSIKDQELLRERLSLNNIKVNATILENERKFEERRIAIAKKAADERAKQLEKEKKENERLRLLELKRIGEVAKLEADLLLTVSDARERELIRQAQIREQTIDENVKDDILRTRLLLENEARLQEDIQELRDDTKAEERQAKIQELEDNFQAAQEKLDQEIALGESELKVRKATEDELQRFQLEAQKRRLELSLQFGELFTETEVQTIRNTIKAIEDEIGTIGKGVEDTGDKSFNLLSLAGLDESEQQAIREASDAVIDAINDVSRARIEAIEKEIAAREKRVDELETLLDAEVQLNKQGFASNIKNVKAALTEEQKQRDNALRAQARAQRVQIALETATQASSLITASANTFQSLSPGFPATLPIAIATVAALVGAFTASRIAAFNATRVNLSGGGPIDFGHSDLNGGKGNRVGNSNLYVGRGEYVVNKNTTDKQASFLEMLNGGMFDNVDLIGLLSGGVMAGMRTDTNNAINNINVIYNNEEAIENSTKQIVSTLNKLIGKKQISIGPDGSIYYYTQDSNGNSETKKVKRNEERKS